MADLLKMMRDLHALTSGLGISDDDFAVLHRVAITVQSAKFTVPTPGTEAKLNGVSVSDISALVVDIPAGQPVPTTSEIIRNLGGNPKSNKDRTKVVTLLPDVPEINIIPGQKTQMLRRIGPVTTNNDTTN